MTTPPEQIRKSLDFFDPDRRLIELGREAVDDFVAQAKGAALDNALRHLPLIPGFNRGTEGEKRQQRLNLVNAVSTEKHVGERERYRRGYTYLWMSIARTKLGVDAPLSKSDDFRIDASVANRLLDSVLFNEGASGLSRETLSTVLAFSPLKLNEEVVDKIRRLRTKAEIERDVVLEALPKRFDELLARCRSLDDRANSAHANIVTIETRQAQLSGGLDEALKEIGDLRKATTRATNRDPNAEQHFDKTLMLVHGELESHASMLQSLSRRLDEAAAFRKEHITSEIGELRRRLSAVAEELDEVRALTADRQTATPPPAAKDERRSGMDRRAKTEPTDRVQYALMLNDGPEPLILPTWAKAKSAMSAVLSALGLPRRTARELGLQIVAALRAGQVPIMAGSVGDPLALELARAFAGSRPLRAVLQAGSFDSLRAECMEQFAPTGLVVTGMSHVAFDIAGGDLRSAVVRSQLGWDISFPMLAFASFEQGPAALPLSLQVVELGPVIDVDELPWRVKGDASQRQQFRFESALLNEREHHVPPDANFAQRLDEDLRSARLRPSRAWRAAAERFHSVLLQLAKDADETTSIDAEELEEMFDSIWLRPLVFAQEPDSQSREALWTQMRKRSNTARSLEGPATRPSDGRRS